MTKDCLSIENCLRQIAKMLILNGTLVESPGLVNGKMGISIFFFHYALYTNNELFENYALDLIREIQAQIHNNSPADYEDGLAGIGTGIDYLFRNNFLQAEDDIFEEFDQRMVRAVLYDPWQDFSLYDGLAGYGRYWIARSHYPTAFEQAQKCLLHIAGLIEERISDISTDEQTDICCFLQDLCQISGSNVRTDICPSLQERCQREWDLPVDMKQGLPRLSDSVVGSVAQLYQRSHYFKHDSQNEMDVALKQISDFDMNKPPDSMGLLNGYAGEGLLRLTALNQTNKTWMLLL